MLTCPFFWVDAFTMGSFTGNPAGVCALTAWPSDDCLQQIARQNGLAETAFFIRVSPGLFHLRWFTPAVEIDLCGHATLATAHVLFNELNFDGGVVQFTTKSGRLTVAKRPTGELALDFPSRPPAPVTPEALPPGLLTALNVQPAHVVFSGRARDWFLELPDENAVRQLTPDFPALQKLDTAAIIVCAPGRSPVDFVSRFFAPNYGINEDPVTGSAHCTLIPHWARRLGKNTLNARQISPRGGRLSCEHQGDHVSMAGLATTYIRGQLMI